MSYRFVSVDKLKAGQRILEPHQNILYRVLSVEHNKPYTKARLTAISLIDGSKFTLLLKKGL